jgi:ribosome maturation factor RimP
MNWQSVVERTVASLGYVPVDLERSSGGLLRVYIERLPAEGSLVPAESITVDDCEKVTRQLQYVLEVEGVDYARLEVSSPGLDRPLKTPADWQRFAGERIVLTLRAPLDGQRKWTGVLESRESGWGLVVTEGKSERSLDFTLDDVREARLVPVLDFKGRRAAKTPVPADGGQEQ